ncbi:TPA: lanthionine synthetase LanC family protein [Streptococcus pyogenes]
MEKAEKENGKVYWVSDFSDSEMLNGLSHGQSGIAYALLLSWKTNKNYNYLKIAKSVIDFENTRISDGNWIDFRNNCTRVLVTHRLNTVEKADKILIMDNGKIIDYGSHHCLYKNNEYYRDLYDSYMNNYQEEEIK